MQKPRIGFIGLGAMGMPMAQRLLEAGYPLTVYNRTQKKMMGLVGKGATGADSPKSVAALSRIIITMLPDSPDVHEVVLGPNGVLEGARKESVVIDMSSILPSAAREIAETLSQKEIAFLDAPVSGSTQGAQEGTLSIMVGGSESILLNVRPVLEVLGKSILRTGHVGSGQLAKLGNQIIVALELIGPACALALAERGGAIANASVEAWRGGLAESCVLERKAARMLARNFPPAFKARLHLKDIRNAEITIRELFPHFVAAPTSTLNMVHPMLDAVLFAKRIFELAMEMGYGDEDHSAVIRDFDL